MEHHRISRLFFPCLLWGVLLVLYFAPILPRSRVLAPLDILETLEAPWARQGPVSVHNTFCYDAISQYIPYEFAVHESLRDDGHIGWNPMTNGGTALAENHMLCPGSLRYVFHRFLPFWDAWDIGRMMHCFLAGVGMIFLLIESGRSAEASVLGALTFSFCSQMVVWIHSDVIASGCCWTPWMIWAFLRLNRIMTETGNGVHPWTSRAGAVLVAGLLCGQALRGGFLHTALFNLSTLLIIFFTYLLVSQRQALKQPQTFAIRNQIFKAAAVAVVLAFAISFPWFQTVVPSALHGGHALRSFPMVQGLRKLPTLITAFLPMVLGTPQGIDATKAFGSDFTEVKFAGGTALALALLAIRSRKAPLLPKVLFVTFLVIPFTPLSKWFYHRCFVLSALGIGWLAAWQLDEQRSSSPLLFWRNLLRLFAIVCVGWFAISIAMIWLEPSILPAIQSSVSSHLPPDKVNRTTWMAERTIRFWHESRIWSPWTMASVLSLGIGLFAASRIRPGARFQGILCGLVIIAAFSETVLFGRRIWYAAERPAESAGSPYPDRAWVRRFVSHLGNGSVLFWQPAERFQFDYMQINAPSACGIRQAEGYESVQPRRLAPRDKTAFIPADYAMAGISHVSCPHGVQLPNGDAWIRLESSPDYDLYANPAFQSIFMASLGDGSQMPLFAAESSPNHIQMMIPPGVTSLYIAMSHHSGWAYRLDDLPWQPLQLSKNGYWASEIVFPRTLEQPTELDLAFR